MDLVTLLPGSVLSLTAQAADRLLELGDPDAALLYLCLLRRGSPQGLKWTPQRLQAAQDKLVSQRLAQPGAPSPAPEPPPPQAEEPPEYTLEDITAALGQDSFSGLTGEVERRLGRKLSTADLKTLYTLYDHLALPAEVILLILTWCGEEVERKYGPGRKPFLSQIKREAFRWARQGVDTVEAAEEHLKRLQYLRTREGEISRLLDLPQRPLVDSERRYIAAWVEMGFDDGALRLAYEKTVMGTASKSMDWRYMNSILRRWHEKGLHTAPQVQAGDAAPRRTSGPAKAAPAGPDKQAQADMERMRRLMQQMKKEEG